MYRTQNTNTGHDLDLHSVKDRLVEEEDEDWTFSLPLQSWRGCRVLQYAMGYNYWGKYQEIRLIHTG